MKKYESFLIWKEKDRIIEALDNNKVLIVESPTGSGKSIGIPIILYQCGYAGVKKIGITQPRRIAALNVCSFIKDQLDIKDEEIACKIRFYDESTANTKIKIMTDGILLEELKKDPLLESYSIIMIDEAHERSLNIDFVLGLIKDILKKRDDLKLIISSATINTEMFSRYFDGAPIVSLTGKSYPVEIVYDPIEGNLSRYDFEDALIDKIAKIAEEEVYSDSGDILIFLSGEKLIKLLCSRLNYDLRGERVRIYPLYSRLSKEEQTRVFEELPKGTKKIIVATNIAETSITIDGVDRVIDSGLVKISYFNQLNYTSSLIQENISRSSAVQRAGRAGRTCPGKCYRIYTEEDFNSLKAFPSPEVINSDLSEVVLRLLDIGKLDVENFSFISNVDKGNIFSALLTLKDLSAIDEERNLTGIGKFMSKFPLPVRLSRILAEAVFTYPGAIEKITTLLGFLSTRSPLLRNDEDESISRRKHRKFENSSGDFVSLLEIYNYYDSFGEDFEARDNWCDNYYLDKNTMGEIYNVKKQLLEILAELNIPVVDDCNEMEYFSCVIAGFRQFICKKINDRAYISTCNAIIFISPSSLYKFRGDSAMYIVAFDIVDAGRMIAHYVSPIMEKWIRPYGIEYSKTPKKLAKAKKSKSNKSSSKKKKKR